jgi:hypothetical protein
MSRMTDRAARIREARIQRDLARRKMEAGLRPAYPAEVLHAARSLKKHFGSATLALEGVDLTDGPFYHAVAAVLKMQSRTEARAAEKAKAKRVRKPEPAPSPEPAPMPVPKPSRRYVRVFF